MEKLYIGNFYTGFLNKNNFLEHSIASNIKSIKNIIAQHAHYLSITNLFTENIVPGKKQQKRYSAKIWKSKDTQIFLPKVIKIPKDKKNTKKL